MTTFLRLSARAYSGVLRFYPEDLRRDFGPDIRAAFAEDLADAWRFCGVSGITRVWHCAMCELFRIALPGLKANPRIAVPFVMLAFNVLVVGVEVLLHLLYVTPLKNPSAGPFAWSPGNIILGTSIVVTLIASAVVRAAKVDVTALKLNS